MGNWGIAVYTTGRSECLRRQLLRERTAYCWVYYPLCPIPDSQSPIPNPFAKHRIAYKSIPNSQSLIPNPRFPTRW